VLCAATGQ